MRKIGCDILSDLEDALEDYKVDIKGPNTDGDYITIEIDYNYEDFYEGEDEMLKSDLQLVIDDWGLGWDWNGSHIFLTYKVAGE